MRLLIAEKPSVALAIAKVVGVAGGKNDGFVECKDGLVCTWAFGHLLKLDSPESYTGGRVKIEDLPIIPKEFKKSVKDDPGAKKQLKIIFGLLKKCTSVIHGGDPDREGQLLIDEILQEAGYDGCVERLWLSAVDPQSIKNALANLRDNADYKNLSISAELRSQADWLTGMNCSIALSRKIQAAGGQAALSIGRVQTPTLALLTQRESDLNSFAKRLHYTVNATVSPNNIVASWRIPGDLLTDDLLLDKAAADACAAKVARQPAVVSDFSKKIGQRATPLPYSLSALQKVASAKFGLSAAKTLKAAQNLYENGVTTYPRTDCQYLPAEQFGAAGSILSALKLAGIAGADGADAGLKHACWDTSKIEAHHAIIPTGENLGGLSGDEDKLFSLIAESYIRLFYEAEKFENREAVFNINGEVFVAKSKTVINSGWTKLGGTADDEANDSERIESGRALPDLTPGDKLTCESGDVIARETNPPKAYTDGSLIGAMSSVHSLVTDQRLKEKLKETSGLGTEATRAGIIETLIARGYAMRDKKNIRATATGLALIKSVKSSCPSLTDPALTAIWEDALSAVAAGKLDGKIFFDKQIESVKKSTAALLSSDTSALGPAPSKFACPACAKNTLSERKTKTGFQFYSCTSCNKAFFVDSKNGGKPGAELKPKS